MRKNNLVKAMACFMAATMAITCVPSVNVINGVSIVAEAAVTIPDPIAKFEFDANGLKDSVSNNEATLTGSHTFSEATKTSANFAKDGALILDGTYGVKLPESAVPTGNKYTISYSVKVTESAQFASQIFLLGDSTDEAANWVNIGRAFSAFENEYLVWNRTVGATPDWPYVSAGTNVQPINEYHTFTIVVDEAKVSIYRDGRLVADEEGQYSFKNESNKTEIYLGVDAFEADPAFKGEIKDLAIYNSALSAEQVLGIVPVNPCTDIILNDTKPTVTVGIPFNFTAKLEGQKAGEAVTDPVTAAAINANIEVVNDDGKEFTLKVTPLEVATGSIVVTCGAIEETAKVATYNFSAVESQCTNLICSSGTTASSTADGPTSIVVARAGQITPITITASSDNATLVGVSVPVTVVSYGAIQNSNGISVTDVSSGTEEEKWNAINSIGDNIIVYAIENSAGKTSTTYYVKTPSGETKLKFRCGDEELVVKLIGDTSTSITTPVTPIEPIEPTTPTDPATPGAITTPGAVTDEPGEPETPTEPEAPTEPVTPAEPTTPTEPADTTTTTTTKKVAKLSAVKTTKGKKAVSGKVTIKATGKLVKKATVKIYLNGKKNVTATTKATGKFSAKLSRKLKKGDKVKFVVTKTTIKKVTKTVTIS